MACEPWRLAMTEPMPNVIRLRFCRRGRAYVIKPGGIMRLRCGARAIERAAAALLLAITVTAATPSARAGVSVDGDVHAVRLQASHAPVGDVLSALETAFNVRYRSSIALDRGIHGTYTGRLDRVIARVLDGYNYVLKHEKDAIEIVVLGRLGEAVASATPKKVSPPKDPAWEQTKARHRRPPAKSP
jgi:hypothetical protein